MPGRVILRFDPPKDEVSSSGLVIPDTSKTRPEFGYIHDVGEPVNEEQRKIAARLRELQAAGARVAVSYGAGVSYWHPNYNSERFGWLKDFRAYRLEEPAAIYIEEA